MRLGSMMAQAELVFEEFEEYQQKALIERS